ncbi:hypothetical protein FPRO06_11308 [Fusarium proliferatum]|uniref:BTB domain-containing protein n=2 Tax=Gibberella intermedia TaxID=948311 RepID=A0A1L7W4Y8_FUSPR|nr:uncharacterized protein FPRO_13360 [Fusarium proliferatum ET1]KAG4254014.1 hypothetical protein FPRO03_06354 [Fusarium proliferatum]KAI1059706.1 hypothetical protein LB506_008816 [Fusarium annulatum]KAG4278595.1 hypothetical protein FPRO04_06650 [Fusarium proliferatum]KAG4279975.1 hypothetical protein FPRO06_11308 [Fusarium proliferatum]RBA20251.1 hypothetical protein FPRO05_08696 [Fusarium proliferatum]
MEASRPVLSADRGDSPESSVVKITHDGDVMLVVGQSQHKIQVSSHFLKLISPFFQAMFNAPMKEGQALATRNDGDPPVEINLPEDKALPMAQLLYTLYGSDPGAKNLPIHEVKDMAILAEKYGMVPRIEIFASFWLRNAALKDSKEVTQNDWNGLIVAYLLKDDQAFYNLTYGMQFGQESLLEFADSFPENYTGLRLGLALEEVRRASLDDRNGWGGKMGLCMFCFSQATDSFVRKRADCSRPERHFPWLPQA